MNWDPESGCSYCGRVILCGPPCCERLVAEIASRSAAERALEHRLREERHLARRSRHLARRAARREAVARGAFAAFTIPGRDELITIHAYLYDRKAGIDVSADGGWQTVALFGYSLSHPDEISFFPHRDPSAVRVVPGHPGPFGSEVRALRFCALSVVERTFGGSLGESLGAISTSDESFWSGVLESLRRCWAIVATLSD